MIVNNNGGIEGRIRGHPQNNKVLSVILDKGYI